MSEPQNSETKYDAFISYRRSDGSKVAHWLRRELESFRAPRSLRSRFDRRLRVYLDTAYERGTSDFYESSIRPALLASRWLVVIATPDAVARPAGTEDWMRREVADFSGGRFPYNVVTVRAAGEFDDPLPADLAVRFPNIEIVDLRGASRFWFLNPTRASRLANEKLKLIAPLLELPAEEMPKLRQEEERRQQARLGAAAGLSMAVLTAVSATSIYALQSSLRAARALEDSMFATGRMIITTSANIDSGEEIRSNLLNQGCDLLDKLGAQAAREPAIAELVICRIERGLAHERLKEPASARAEFQQAIELAADRHGRTGRQDAALRLVEARQALAEYLLRQKDTAGAEVEFTRLLDDAQRLQQLHEKTSELARAEGEGLGKLGDIHAGSGDPARARRDYLAAADAVGNAVEWGAGESEGWLKGWRARLLRLAGEQSQGLGDPAAALQYFEQSLALGRTIKPDQISGSTMLDAAQTNALVFAQHKRQGNADAAERARGEAMAAIARVESAAAASPELKGRAERIKSYIGRAGSAEK